MKNRKIRRKKKNSILLLFLVILGITVGFAYLSTTLGINGIAGIKGNSWDIHWDNASIKATEGSITPKTAAYVSDEERKNVDFAVELELPGDFYEFTVDAVNGGTVAGKVSKVETTFYKKGTTTEIEKPDYYIFSITHEDGSAIEDDEIIPGGAKKTYKVRIEFDKEATELPSSEESEIEITPVVGTIDPTKYLVEFNPNGGTVSQLGIEVDKTKAIGTMPTATKKDYYFKGWYTEIEAGEKVESNYVPTDDMTLYAHWTDEEPIPASATFDIGSNVNTKLKTLAGDTLEEENPQLTIDSNVTAIIKSTTAPDISSMTEDNIISAEDSAPIYAWFDNGTIYWWTASNTVYLNADSSVMFNNFTNVNLLDLSFDTSNVTNMSGMFAGFSYDSLDLSGFDTSNVTDMSGMFVNSNIASLNLSSFDTKNVTNMSSMFLNSKLTSINLSNFDTKNVTNMSGMFASSSFTSLDVSNFDVSKVMQNRGIGGMFSGARNLQTINISTWDFSNLSSSYPMYQGFIGNPVKTLIMDEAILPQDCSELLSYQSSLETISLIDVDTSNVTNMSRMFYNSTSLTELNLTSFDTSKVTNMSEMFYSASNLTTISVSDSFVVDQVTSSTNMFCNCNKLVGGKGTTYTYWHLDKEYARYDGGSSQPGYFNARATYPQTVTFDANGGTVDPETKIVNTYDEIGELPTPHREHYEFKGWYTEAVDGTEVTSDYIVTDDITIYAHWEELHRYTITFNANGGTMPEGTDSITVYENEAVGELPVPTRAKYKLDGWYTNLTDGELVDSTYTTTCNLTLYAIWKVDFANDDWEDIVDFADTDSSVCNDFKVGDTKTINMETLGTHTLRIANCSYDDECNNASNSQTACGLIIEFADGITTHQFNPYTNGSVNGDGTKGGWEESNIRTYLNNEILNEIPSNVRNLITDTQVVSGHGSNDSSNFTTTDKLYLLSTKEVWGKKDETNAISNDSAEEVTRQLDYYENKGVTTSNYQDASKNSIWWLRSPKSDSTSNFYAVASDGSFNDYTSSDTNSIAPAFRIAITGKYKVTFDANGGQVNPTSTRVEIGDAIETLPTPTRRNYTFGGWYTEMSYINKVENGYIPANNITLYAKWTYSPEEPIDFATSPIEDIIDAVDNDNTEDLENDYENEKKRPITIYLDTDEDGIKERFDTNLRILNISTPEECNDPDFSQSACGLIVDFEGLLGKHMMNPKRSEPIGQGNYSDTEGGWRDSEMRRYVNNEVYNALPSDLKNAIKLTKVISGHSKMDTEDFVTYDKLFLLSLREIYTTDDSGVAENDNAVITHDSAWTKSRQLDYFAARNVRFDREAGEYAKKRLNGVSTEYWHRTADKDGKTYFTLTNSVYGWWNLTTMSYGELGVSPAFRLGN